MTQLTSKSSSKANVKTTDTATAEQLQTALFTEQLTALGIDLALAKQLAEKLTQGEEEAKETTAIAINAAAKLQLVGAESEVAAKVISEIIERRLTDASSGGTADALVGKAVIETLTGKPAPVNISRAGEVANALIDAWASLQIVGIEDTAEGQNLLNRIVVEGLRGDKAKVAISQVTAPVIEAVQRGQAGTSGSTNPSTVDKATPADPAVEKILIDNPPDQSGQPAQGSGTTPAESTPNPAGPNSSQSGSPSEAPTAPSTPGGEGTPANNNSAQAGGVYLGQGTLISEDPALNGQPVSLYEDPASGGGLYAVTADGTVVPIADGRVVDAAGTPTNPRVVGAGGETTVTAEQGQGTSNPPSNSQEQTEDGESDSDDDDDSTDTPSTESENKTESGEASTATETTDDAAETPNPEAETRGNGFELREATDGRLGNASAGLQLDRLDFLNNGGGAGTPPSDRDETSVVLLTPEEQANFERLLGIKQGDGVSTPNPVDESGFAITERDLKELFLRGGGGAGSPLEGVKGPMIQDPKSLIGGLLPSPQPGVKVDALTGISTAGFKEATKQIEQADLLTNFKARLLGLKPTLIKAEILRTEENAQGSLGEMDAVFYDSTNGLLILDTGLLAQSGFFGQSVNLGENFQIADLSLVF